MPNQKRTQDQFLENGSIVYWSRRRGDHVPVRCGLCQQERIHNFTKNKRKDFSGICRQCATGETRQDQSLSNGSIVFWSQRQGQRVPVRCGICGKEHWTHAASVRQEKFWGYCRKCRHTGTLSTTWRGGRKVRYGYVYVKIYPDHPFYEMADKDGYVAEHRLVMAQHLGRALERSEPVHHKNSNKQDNRIENLELFTSLKELGHAVQDSDPHAGHVPASKLKHILQRIENMLKAGELLADENEVTDEPNAA